MEINKAHLGIAKYFSCGPCLHTLLPWNVPLPACSILTTSGLYASGPVPKQMPLETLSFMHSYFFLLLNAVSKLIRVACFLRQTSTFPSYLYQPVMVCTLGEIWDYKQWFNVGMPEMNFVQHS